MGAASLFETVTEADLLPQRQSAFILRVGVLTAVLKSEKRLQVLRPGAWTEDQRNGSTRN